MDEREINIFCEYVLLPRLNRFLEYAKDSGLDAFLTIGGDGLPAIEIESKEGGILVSMEALETDWEMLEDLSPDACVLMIRITLRLSGADAMEKAGFMLFPEEAVSDAESFLMCVSLTRSGIWLKDNAVNVGCDKEEEVMAAYPRLNALSDLIGEAGLEYTDIFNIPGEWPFVIADSAGKAIRLSYIMLSDNDEWLLRMTAENDEGENVAAVFPESGKMKDAEFYEKEIGIFERYYLYLGKEL